MVKKYKNLLLLLLVLFSGSINSVFGQVENSQETAFNKNSVYGNVGVAGLYFTATGYYERLVAQNSDISSFVKFGIGSYALWGEGGQYILAQYGILTGAKKHHLEIGAGLNTFLSGDLEGDFLPLSGTIGWRIQKPGGNFIFRTGLSFPEAAYIGFGGSL